MKTQLIMFDTPIIVSDEGIQDGDKILSPFNEIQTCIGFKTGIGSDLISWIKVKETTTFQQILNCEKIIAGLPDLSFINWNGLEEEFGWIDIEKLVEEDIPSVFSDDWKNGVKHQGKNLNEGHQNSWTKGFKKAQSLNEKKFSLEDMRKMYDMSCGKIGLNLLHNQTENNERFNDFIQSLQQPKVFDIEVEMECAYGDECLSEGSYLKQHLCKVQPKITNNSIKILRKL